MTTIYFTEGDRVPMIAPAMKTHDDNLLNYRDLARREASIDRCVTEDLLPRCKIFGSDTWRVNVNLQFGFDADGNVKVQGEFEAEAKLECKYCLEKVPAEYKGEINLCLVEDDELAASLASHSDVVLVAGDEASISDIIEDEVLMRIPEKLCSDASCNNAVSMDFPAKEQDVQDGSSPFSVLRDLIN